MHGTIYTDVGKSCLTCLIIFKLYNIYIYIPYRKKKVYNPKKK